MKGELPVSRINIRKSSATFLAVGMLALASCESDKKDKEPPAKAPADFTTVSVQPGEAGGMVEDTFTVTATVSAVDKSTRKITLKGETGEQTSFTAGPEIRNFDQIQAGDKVTATITERLNVFVRGSGTDPSVSHSAALAAAPKGAKPGVLVAETYEVVAAVKAIDTAKRTATLQFSDGQTKVVPVRSDVDLARYKVGDNVVIRVSAALSVLVEKP